MKPLSADYFALSIKASALSLLLALFQPVYSAGPQLRSIYPACHLDDLHLVGCCWRKDLAVHQQTGERTQLEPRLYPLPPLSTLSECSALLTQPYLLK
jgi:hypothetical protein